VQEMCRGVESLIRIANLKNLLNQYPLSHEKPGDTYLYLLVISNSVSQDGNYTEMKGFNGNQKTLLESAKALLL